MDPLNRTGQSGVDPLSRNIHWSQPVINLKGRACLDLNLSLVYNLWLAAVEPSASAQSRDYNEY
jgi:hypothetical protein